MNNKEGDTLVPSPPWRKWLLRNLADGIEPSLLIDTLGDRGVSPATAASWIRALSASQEFTLLREMTRTARQTRAYLSLRRQLNTSRERGIRLREHTALGAADFFEDYYFENRPVVIRGFANHWPARNKWTPEWLKENYGQLQVKITDDRNSNPNYDMEHQRHTRVCSLAEYTDLVLENRSGNNAYMVANNRNIEHPDFSPILSDVDYDLEMFDPQRWKSCTAFWFGPASTVTPLHHDTCNIMFVQIYGRKTFKLYSPLESDLLQGARSMYAAIDPERPNHELHPNFSTVQEYEVTLQPGDAIFLPIGWWHHVRALDISISLAMTNFVVPNHFDWFRPGEVV